MDRQTRKEQLGRLQVLFSQKEWQDFQQEVRQMYNNYDMKVHNINCENRDFYVGKCAAILEIMDLEDKIEKEKGDKNK